MSASNFWQGKQVLVTGAGGFVGRNLVPLLARTGCDLVTPSRQDYDLLEQEQVRRLYREVQPEIVLHLAGLVGGILDNKTRPAEFCYQNLIIGTMMLEEARRAGVVKYVGLMGGCSYPAHAPSPIRETELWNGYPQPESAPYSLAKAMSVVQAQAYRQQYGFHAIVLVPGNIYGPFDNFDLNRSHVIPALIRKFLEAKASGREEVVVWGSGRPTRDFIYIEDACEAILLGAEKYDEDEIINLSSGTETPIKELVQTVAELVGYEGTIRWDATKPDGQIRKGFDPTRMHERLGYRSRTSLREGLAKTIAWYKAHSEDAGSSPAK